MNQTDQDRKEVSRRVKMTDEEFDFLFEIDMLLQKVRPVFQRETPLRGGQVSGGESDLDGFLNTVIDEKDRVLMRAFLSDGTAEALNEEKKDRKVEFRMTGPEGKGIWSVGKLFCRVSRGQKRFFLGIRRQEREESESIRNYLTEGCLGIVELELSGGTADVRWPFPGKEPVRQAAWNQLAARFGKEVIYPEDYGKFQEAVSLERMRERAVQGAEGSIELRYRSKAETYGWARIQWIPKGGGKIWITIRDISEQKVFRQMVKAICGDCDFFLCLNGNDGSFDVHGEVPDFVKNCRGYADVIDRYVGKYVAASDQKRVQAEMKLDRVLRQLDHVGEHDLSFGVLVPGREYERKQLRYVYYEREQKKILLTCRDITRIYQERVRRREEMRRAVHRSRTDELTGLYNRFARELIAGRLEHEEEKAAVLFIDMDNFKMVNDTWGHAAGDRFLKEVADILKAATRSCDIGGRLGGDEFVVYLSGLQGEETALGCAQRLRCSIRELVEQNYREVNVSCCIGVAIYPDDGTDVRQLFECADQAAYYAKRNGKNRVVSYSRIEWGACEENQTQTGKN